MIVQYRTLGGVIIVVKPNAIDKNRMLEQLYQQCQTHLTPQAKMLPMMMMIIILKIVARAAA